MITAKQIGDYFWVNVYDDGVYGHYFELEAGATKCPWEFGTAKREVAATSITRYGSGRPSSAAPAPGDPPARARMFRQRADATSHK